LVDLYYFAYILLLIKFRDTQFHYFYAVTLKFKKTGPHSNNGPFDVKFALYFCFEHRHPKEPRNLTSRGAS
jgi:hypothetical protein